MPADHAFLADLSTLINKTPLVDTHEHLPEEDDRIRGQAGPCDDWSSLVGHYLDEELAAAGMPIPDIRQFLSRDLDPKDKWPLLAPYWPAVKYAGYARAVRIAVQELYNVDDLNQQSIPRIQAGYEALRKPGFYKNILVQRANIESCQVDSLFAFRESAHPTLLMQDLNILNMHSNPTIPAHAEPAGKTVRDLDDWHNVIRWWFDKYGPYAVAAKSQAAYRRALDYAKVPAERAAPVFRRVVDEAPISEPDRKLLEDHLFWFCVEQATQRSLPVKVHTGYLGGHDYMPLERVQSNCAQAAALCRESPDTQWVFMHIAYPYWPEMLAVAKHYRNAHIDMCWAWIMDPAASTRFLESYIAAAPANKVFVFGGDYVPVECVLGHARMARQGVARALSELVDKDYMSRADALELVEPLLRGNARHLYKLAEKTDRLRTAPWL